MTTRGTTVQTTERTVTVEQLDEMHRLFNEVQDASAACYIHSGPEAEAAWRRRRAANVAWGGLMWEIRNGA